MKPLLLIPACLLGIQCLLPAQSVAKEEKSADGRFTIQYFIGGTGAFAYGSYIDYHRSFHNVEEPNAEISASIQPRPFGTVGIQWMAFPFLDWDWEKLGFSVGLQYFQKGFRNQFKSVYTPSGNLTDHTRYVETYRINTLAIPIQAYWGRRFFGTIGLSIESNFSGKKTQLLDRSQNGSESFNGGYSDKTKTTTKLDKSLIDRSTRGFILGGGFMFSPYSHLRLQSTFSGKLLNTNDNFRTILLQLSFHKSFKSN